MWILFNSCVGETTDTHRLNLKNTNIEDHRNISGLRICGTVCIEESNPELLDGELAY